MLCLIAHLQAAGGGTAHREGVRLAELRVGLPAGGGNSDSLFGSTQSSVQSLLNFLERAAQSIYFAARALKQNSTTLTTHDALLSCPILSSPPPPSPPLLTLPSPLLPFSPSPFPTFLSLENSGLIATISKLFKFPTFRLKTVYLQRETKE